MSIRESLVKWMLSNSILFCIAESSAQSTPEFGYGTIEHAGINMPYRIATIGGGASDKPSLVIYLHGGSSKGSDNEIQMQEAGIDSIARYLSSGQCHALFLVPQCPADKSWGGSMLGVLKALTDRYKGSEADENRIYLFGGSMGGTGTWSMLSAYPGLFAAAMPVAGNPAKCIAENVAHTPFYTVMGSADRIMNLETTLSFLEDVVRVEGEYRFDIEEGWSHEMTCIRSYTAPRLDWIFSHHINSSGVRDVLSEVGGIKYVQRFSIDGKVLTGKALKGLYIERTVFVDGSVSVKKVYK